MATMRDHINFFLACSLIAFCTVVSAQPFSSGPSSSAPGPSAGDPCINNLMNMSDCLTYVEAGSNLTVPAQLCCPELAGLVESNPICLCKLLGTNGSFSSLGIHIDLNRALKLPSVCKVSTPPVSTCAAVGVPVGVPLPGEAALSPVISAQPSPPPQPFASGPSSSVLGPSAGDPCINKLLNMSDCLTYVVAGSNLTVPAQPCCPELAGLVQSNPICLCKFLGTNVSSFGFDIDVSRALKLPSVCKVSTPSVSNCAAVGVPVGVPGPSDGALSPGPVVGVPVGVPPPSAQPPGGLATAPSATSTSTTDNGASSDAGSAFAVTVGLAVGFAIAFLI